MGSIKVERGVRYNRNKPLLTQDFYHMGQKLGSNVEILFATHRSERMEYLIVVDIETGESVRLSFKRA